MKEVFRAVRVTDDVYWVGAIDFAVRNFHGYLTARGTTYNAYLVLAETVVLIDTVKAPFADEMLARIASVTDPGRIDYIVSNHSEPDHSGALAAAIGAIKPKRVYASVKGAETLAAHYTLAHEVTTVSDGASLSLGNRSLTFLETRMCHWPDSMVSYLNEEQLLFSQDAFGMHLATYDLFDDQCDPNVLAEEAAKYYANILLPLSKAVAASLAKVRKLDIRPKIIAPDHGPIWRSEPGKIVASYERWCAQPRTNKAVVLYDTMWTSTDKMARAVGEGLASEGAKVRLMPLGGAHRSDVATEMLDAGALVVGSPTINNEMFPTLADVLSYIKGLKPRGLVGAAFGSYGWSGESAKKIAAALGEMKVELVGEPLGVRYVPDADDLVRCYELGREVGRKIADKGA